MIASSVGAEPFAGIDKELRAIDHRRLKFACVNARREPIQDGTIEMSGMALPGLEPVAVALKH